MTTGNEPYDGATTGQKSHRYLRLSLVLIVFALAAGVVIQAYASGWELLPSISHYFYTPAHSVFVAALIAASLALTALSGRDSESILLDISAIFAPLIAIVPAGIAAQDLPDMRGTNDELRATYKIADADDLEASWPLQGWCSDAKDAGCVPDLYMPGIHTSVWTYISVIVVVVALSLWVHRERLWDERHRETRRNDPTRVKRRLSALAAPVVAAIAAVGIGLLAFGPNSESFPLNFPILIDSVHFAATLLFFGTFAAVPWLNYRRYRRLKKGAEQREPGESIIKPWHAKVYAAVPFAMAADLLLLGILGVGLKIQPWVLIGEFGALFLFAGYWAVQTVQRWHEWNPRGVELPMRGAVASE